MQDKQQPRSDDAGIFDSLFKKDPSDLAKNWLKMVTAFLVSLGVPMQVMLRRDFGERYLSWPRLYFVWGLLIAYFALGTAHGASPLLTLFALAFVGMSLYHRARIWQRGKQGVLWHSRSFGVSRLTPAIEQLGALLKGTPLEQYVLLDRWTLYKWVEPLLCLAIGAATYKIDNVFGLYMLATSAGLLVGAQLAYFEEHGKILDVIDARIEAMHMAGAIEGRPAEETAGFSVVSVAPAQKAFLNGRERPAPAHRTTLLNVGD